MLFSLLAIVAGVLASSSLIISKIPVLKKYIHYLTPFQAVLGFILLAYGLIYFVQYIFLIINFNFIGLLLSVLEIIVGFLLSFDLLSRLFLEKNAKSKAKAALLRLNLLKYQVQAGLLLVVLGVISLLS